ncbi:MAG: hypothetical protein H0W84_12650 [Bacteroidetes bacterium]|nr:hypothetical protein [Bacteroidota bacterium]
MSSNNTEINEWAGLYSIRKDNNSHSGATVAFIDSLTSYSIGYSNEMASISKTKIDSVVFSYWAFLKNDKAQAKSVLSILDKTKGENIFWAGNPLKEKVKEYNKWIEIKETFIIPADIDTKCILSLYVMNNSKEEILLDDFKVVFY